MLAVAFDDDLLIHREFDSELRRAELGDFLVAARFLARKFVSWESEYHQAARPILLVQLLEVGILRSQSALGCDIDDQHHGAFVLPERRLFAIDVTNLEIVQFRAHRTSSQRIYIR